MNPPSLSSFPPSFSSFPDLESDTKRSKSPSAASQPARDRDSERHKRSKKDSERKKYRREKHGHDVVEPNSQRSRDSSRRLEDEKSIPFDDEGEKAKEDWQKKTASTSVQAPLERPLYYSDKKGDPLNLRYGGLDAKEIPRYRPVGYGRKILGLNHAWTAVHRGRQGVEVTVGGRRKQPSITDSSSRALLSAPPTRRLLASAETARKYPEINGFIRLPSRRVRRHEDEAYRSIELPKENADPDFDSSSSASEASEGSDDDDTTTLTSHQERMRDLERQLSTDPASVSTWLALLSHSLSQIPVNSKNATTSRSEITLSILERALSSIPKNTPTARLRLIYLQAGEEVWQSSQLAEEWESALKPGDPEIRMAWLDWRIRNGDQGVDGTLDDVSKVLSILTNEMERLRVLWRLASALKQAGYVERSMALFQAQAELVFHIPSALANTSFEQKLDALEQFWESEVPRIGELGAAGWDNWVAAGKPGLAAIPSSPWTPPLVASNDPYVRWSREELNADEIPRPPLRSEDPASELDPYATILFSDLRPFLFPLTSARSTTAFRLIWLSFLGLHIPGFEILLSPTSALENTDDRWTDAHLMSSPYLAAVYPSSSNAKRITADSQAGVMIGKEQDYSNGFGPVKQWGYRVLGPLDASEFRNGESRWGMWTAEDVEGVNAEFVRKVFTQCRLKGEDVEWDVLASTFEAAINVKSALKLSRTFLANARDSLPHWAVHARLERLRGRLDDARKVYQTVLTAPTSSQNRLSTGPLWWDWAEMEWLAGKSEDAVQVALHAAGVQGSGGVMILRAKRVFEDTVHEIPAMLWKVREAWLRIAALLELLTGADLPYFLTSPLEAGSVPQESMAVASLSMLFHHIVTLHSATRPGVLRERLNQAVELFPNNTVILGMFLEMQKGQGVWGRVRELLSEHGTADMVREKGVARRVVDVWMAGWEKGRWGWEIERTRSGLSAAVDSERTRGSPILWRMFIEFEIRAGELQRAKSLLFRAVGQCPLVKELYMLAFDKLRSVFTPRELNSLGETMAERGLRTRKGLDEALEGWTEQDEDNSESESSGDEDEIEYNAKELKRLKPY